ncbi:MAG: NADH-quinone oxidoreductase subunit A [bacterium]|nr:NADH-quinone oxidoreductase subunit A [bacterium]
MLYTQFAAVLVFIVLGCLFVFGNLLLGSLVRPSKFGKDKMAVYECGEPTIGPSWIRFNSRFYTIALVYLLFDVEVVVLLPAGLVLKELGAAGYGIAALVAILVFLIVLALGLAYEWFWGNLDWIRHTDEMPAEIFKPEQGAGEAAAPVARAKETALVS